MKLKRFLAAAAAVIMMSSTAFAGQSAEGRKEDLDCLYDTLKEGHPDLFYNNPEEVFLAKKQEIEKRMADESDFEFAMDLQSLAALAGDSHTTTSINIYEDVHIFPINVARYDGKWTVTAMPEEYADMVGKRITAMAGVPMSGLYKKFSALCSSDNDESLKKQFEQVFYVDEILGWLGIKNVGEPLKIQLADDNGEKYELELSHVPVEYAMAKRIKLSTLPEKRLKTPPTEYDEDKNYFGKALNDNAYYIQYNRCREDENFTIEAFGKQLESELGKGKYTQIILDLRNNGGGGDGVIQPILKIVKKYAVENNSTIYGLIGKRTFSSAVINSAMIKEMGGFLVGTPTSGSMDHFGSVNSFRLPNSNIRVGYSTKFINLDEYLECAQGYGIEEIQPDLLVEERLEDYINGRDTVVEAILEKPAIETGEKFRPIYYTRGALVRDLYKIAQEHGKADFSAEADFYDVFPFTDNYDAVNWAAEKGIAVGLGDGLFAPARPVTPREAKIISDRFADYMGFEPKENMITGEKISMADGKAMVQKLAD